MNNKLSNLNDHLFAQLERLSDEDIKQEELAEEIERSRALTSVAKEIINSGRLMLDAQVKIGELVRKEDVPTLLT